MTGVLGKVMGWKETSVTSLISVASPPNYRGKGSTEWVLTLVLQAAPTTLFFGKVVNSRTFGSMVGPGKKSCPRSTGASGQNKQAAPFQTQIVPGAPFFGCRRPLSGVTGSGQGPPSPPGSLDFPLQVSLPQKMGPLLTYTPCSEPCCSPTHPNDRCLRRDHLSVQDFRRRHDLY